MFFPSCEDISRINQRIAVVLSAAQGALRGEQEFGVLQVRELSEPVAQMASVMKHAVELRARQPELAPAIDAYRAQLTQLQTTLEQIRIMLLTKRGQMQNGQVQVEKMSRWVAALKQTR